MVLARQPGLNALLTLTFNSPSGNVSNAFLMSAYKGVKNLRGLGTEVMLTVAPVISTLINLMALACWAVSLSARRATSISSFSLRALSTSSYTVDTGVRHSSLLTNSSSASGLLSFLASSLLMVLSASGRGYFFWAFDIIVFI